VWPMSGERSSMVCSMISGSSLRRQGHLIERCTASKAGHR
jgi:hypothetical protein